LTPRTSGALTGKSLGGASDLSVSSGCLEVLFVAKGWKKAVGRIVLLTVVFVGIGGFVLWDYERVNRDFSRLKVMLQDSRYRAIRGDQVLAVRFVGKKAVVEDRKTGKVIKELDVPTLDQVNYDTNLGDDMIIFDGHGTSAYNKREHGGDVRLRSWLGFRKNIAVNCTGLVTEGVYPEN